MADLIKKIKIKKQDGTFTDYIPIGAEAQNISTSDGDSVQLKLNKKPYYYNSVADMKADTKLKAGDMAVTLGYYTVNDGGGAEYKIVSGTHTDDGGSYHELDNSLWAELIVKNEINVKQFGAKGDNTHDDVSNIQNAITYASSKNIFLFFPAGEYLSNSGFSFANNIKIKGDSNAYIVNYGWNLTGSIVEIYNLNFKNIQYSALSMTNDKCIISGCKFENTGINPSVNPTWQGCGIYTGASHNNSSAITDLTVEDCYFYHCNGHGALMICYNSKLNIRNNTFKDNAYRGIHLYGNSSGNLSTGIIENNLIDGCGTINTTDSGVGCNGIYSVTGDRVNVINNRILNCYENGIEGQFKSIIGNYIDNMNCDLVHHPTPSVEGIFLGRCDCIVKNNVLKNIRSKGISHYSSQTTSAHRIIENNIIDTIIPEDGIHWAIYLNEPLLKNTLILNNQVKDMIELTKCDRENCQYSGDLRYLRTTTPIISNCNNLFSYHKDFDNLDGWTYSNCTPTINLDTDINNNVMHFDYQQYNRVVGPRLPYAQKGMGKIRLYAKGKFHINIFNGTTYENGILAVDSNEYQIYERCFQYAGNTDNKTIWIQADSDGSVDIQSFNMDIQYY